MIPESQEIVVKVEHLKEDIGWSWQEICKRLHWSPMQLRNFRDVKRGIDEDEYRYLGEVAQAVRAVRQPAEKSAVEHAAAMPMMPRAPEAQDPGDPRFRSDPLGEEIHPNVTQVRVMTLDDIAYKLAEEYVTIADEPEITGEALASCRWAVSRLALKFGLVDEVKENIQRLRRPSAGAAPPAPAARPAMPPPPPISSRAVMPRGLPQADREEYLPPSARQAEPPARVPFGEDGF